MAKNKGSDQCLVFTHIVALIEVLICNLKFIDAANSFRTSMTANHCTVYVRSHLNTSEQNEWP